MPIALPPTIAAYFAADAGDDLDAFMRLFAPDALVTDERRSYAGLDEIREWKTGPAAAFQYTCEPFAIAEAEGQTIVTGHLSGNFPGSPIDLRYRFTLAGDLIARLVIAP
jgi:ketosteroid isomerase-like protein